MPARNDRNPLVLQSNIVTTDCQRKRGGAKLRMLHFKQQRRHRVMGRSSSVEQLPMKPGRDTQKRSYRAVTALRRGLAVLAAIGQQGAAVAPLSKRTGINRTTLYRILSTLEEEGYLTRSLSTHHYRLSPKVRLLSDGFTDALWVTQIAAPALMQLLRDTAWPGSLATFNGRHMVFRESTHRFSSFFVHKPMIGREIPLSTSLGQVYLAFSAKSVRRPLLGAFASDWEASGFGLISVSEAEQILAKIRVKGYATAVGSLEPSVAAVAMPIRRGGQVLACLNVVTPPGVMEAPKLFKGIREHLAYAVSSIEKRLGEEWT
jgi:IclR family mhp operon transcriptional activator